LTPRIPTPKKVNSAKARATISRKQKREELHAWARTFYHRLDQVIDTTFELKGADLEDVNTTLQRYKDKTAKSQSIRGFDLEVYANAVKLLLSILKTLNQPREPADMIPLLWKVQYQGDEKAYVPKYMNMYGDLDRTASRVARYATLMRHMRRVAEKLEKRGPKKPRQPRSRKAPGSRKPSRARGPYTLAPLGGTVSGSNRIKNATAEVAWRNSMYKVIGGKQVPANFNAEAFVNHLNATAFTLGRQKLPPHGKHLTAEQRSALGAQLKQHVTAVRARILSNLKQLPYISDSMVYRLRIWDRTAHAQDQGPHTNDDHHQGVFGAAGGQTATMIQGYQEKMEEMRANSRKSKTKSAVPIPTRKLRHRHPASHSPEY
jgi:hypothetical protein